MPQRLAIIESIAMTAGLEPLRVATRAGLQVCFFAQDLKRYSTLQGAWDILEGCASIVELDTSNAEELAVGMRNEDVQGAVTMCDYFVPQVATAAEALGLPGLSPTAARTLRDKARVRDLCAAAGVASAAYWAIADTKDLSKAVAHVGLPCVVKPVDESASYGVTLCTNEDDVRTTAELILGRETNARGQSTPRVALLEEYLVGPEVSVEVMVRSADAISIVGVTSKRVGPPPSFVEFAHVFPSTLPVEKTHECERVAVDAIKASKLDFGAAHIEIKVTAEGPRLIEINPRLAGDWIPTLVEVATGYPLLESVLFMHLGRAPSAPLSPNQACAINFLGARPHGGQARVQPEPGLTRSFENLLPDVIAVQLDEDKLVGEVRSNHDRVGHVIARGATPGAALLMAEIGASHSEFLCGSW